MSLKDLIDDNDTNEYELEETEILGELSSHLLSMLHHLIDCSDFFVVGYSPEKAAAAASESENEADPSQDTSDSKTDSDEQMPPGHA